MILIGIDDTDNAASGGTGRLARALADLLRARYRIHGVTRHQLLVDPRIPYTKKNSCNVVHLDAEGVDLNELAGEAAAFVAEGSCAGSAPGVCVAHDGRACESEFGLAAQTRVIERAEAVRVARRLGCILRGIGGTEQGIIGALAGVVLAAGGDDGRYVEVGRVRELGGALTVEQILDAGVAQVRSTEGLVLDAGEVECARGVRPNRLGHRPVLFVARRDGRLVAVRDREGAT
jgi:hypothetical protein